MSFPNKVVKVVKLAEAARGPKGRLFCTEAVVTWFNQAGIPITNMQPDHVPPKFIAENYFNDTLLELGYLRYIP
jgi:hypothetical protein